MFPFCASTCDDTNDVHATTLAESGGEVAHIISQELYFFDSLDSPPEPYFFDSPLTITSSQDSHDSLDFLDCFPWPT